MKILVTGGAGFIGSSIVDTLLAKGHDVVVYDNLNKYYSGKEKNTEGFKDNPGCTLVKGDILEPGNLLKAMGGCDAVFHEAAQAGVRYSLDHPDETTRINVMGTLNVLEAARKSGIKKLIFASSSSVYGGGDGRMVEDQAKMPISPYGASKLACEHYLHTYHHLYAIPTVMLRYFTVYGPRQRPDMGIRRFIGQVMDGQSPVIYGDGEQTRDFTYISDIVDANMLALEKDFKGCDAFNIGGGKDITVNKLISTIIDCVGTEVKPTYVGAKPGDVYHTLADVSKARRVFGYEPKVPIREGIAMMVEWVKQNEA